MKRRILFASCSALHQTADIWSRISVKFNKRKKNQAECLVLFALSVTLRAPPSRCGSGTVRIRVGWGLVSHRTIYRIHAIRFIVQSHRVTFRSPLRHASRATVSLRLGHTRGLTVINCHSIPSCRFATQSERIR